ncbi:MAG: hypothetical protein WCC12_23735 [Anaerolineales bacterium]
MKLAHYFSERKKTGERQNHLRQALEATQSALDIYQKSGGVQIVECISEEILYRHSWALKANDRAAEAAEFLGRAHAEMMRKHDLIPPESPFRKTYLKNIQLHRDIQVAYAAQNTRAVPPLAVPFSEQERAR